MLYTPCPEHQSSRNPEPFLPGDPLDLMRAGKFKKVPWIVGANSQDMAVFMSGEYPEKSCDKYPCIFRIVVLCVVISHFQICRYGHFGG
jgi:hypothetical protein